VVFEPTYKKPGDLIKSDEWNKIIDELVNLKKYIDSMSISVTLTSLPSPTGISRNLTADDPDDFNFGISVMGLITKHYSGDEKGEICKFGINDYADIIYYWACAAKGDRELLKITVEYVDGTTFTTENLFINEGSKLRPRGNRNLYIEYLQSPNQHIWYKYRFENPSSEKEIRYLTFEDISSEKVVRIANVMHYSTRVKPPINTERS
jgi:hypothetical protein